MPVLKKRYISFPNPKINVLSPLKITVYTGTRVASFLNKALHISRPSPCHRHHFLFIDMEYTTNSRKL
jgi:hypothetical protein